MNMAERIRERRKIVGLSQMELANLIGVSYITIRRWESTGRTPNVSVMPKLAEILNTSVMYLMGLNDNPSSNQENTSEIQVAEKTSENEDDKSLSYKMENKDTGMASFTSKDGNRFEAPATPEGYAFLREMLRASEMPK